MQRIILAVFGVLFVGFTLWVIAFMEYKIWLGGYQLTVRITRPADGKSVHILRYVVVANRNEAEEILSLLPIPKTVKAADWVAEIKPMNDSKTGLSIACEVHVRTSGRDSMIGTNLKYFRLRFLVVVADLDDGTQVGVIAELPDAKHAGEVIVTLP